MTKLYIITNSSSSTQLFAKTSFVSQTNDMIELVTEFRDKEHYI